MKINPLNIIKNKYILAVLAFIVWMLFFDRNDIFSQLQYVKQRHKLQEERDFYVKEITDVRKSLNLLNNNLASAETFAREKYFMKKDNEDVFIIIKNQEKPKETQQ